ncbi:HNH endonuclease [bacterium]|nr:HNH endonuclease [bacterium]
MNPDVFLSKTISKFEKWYVKDDHRKNITAYDDIITKEKIESLTNDEFVNFFYDFVSEGGKIQSGGYRTKNLFKEYLENNLTTFKKFILEPFSNNFNFDDWFNRINEFSYFGVGIATIYLNRINKNDYSVLNNKTLKALREVGYNLSLTKNLKNYKEVNRIQKQWTKTYPFIDNLYKADALNHFLIGTDKGKQLLRDNIYKEFSDDNFEQEEIIEKIDEDKELQNEAKLLKLIIDNEKSNQETITVNLKTYKRHNYLMALIKKYRKYTCQFCSTKILKENEEYYIEACHIRAKSDGGKDSFDNILILCPNCHKLFDYGKKEKINHTKDFLSVKINGKDYKADLRKI